MSLNGLDASAVTDAHRAALSEAGGWFLLKYTTRDTVELLSKGSSGVTEARAAVEEYSEKSPLYGLVQYRRKKIVLKYVPEGTSRLLQVRLIVQFQSILETFLPHDTVISFSEPSELTEAALSQACMLHPSGTSLTSSSSSLRKQRLGEISEDVEEGISGTSTSRSQDSPVKFGKSGLEMPASSAPAPMPTMEEEAGPLAVEEKTNQSQPRVITPVPTIEKSLPSPPISTPTATREEKAGPSETRTVSEQLRPASRARTDNRPVSRARDESIPEEPRESTQSGRPSVSELDKIAQIDAYLSTFPAFKPKKKLGPRPHVETPSRPQTSTAANKPSAGLPSSVRAAIRPPFSQSDRPSSRQSSRSVPSRFLHYVEPAVVPPVPAGDQLSSLYLPQPTQRTPSRPPSIALSVQNATPEKLRLMKALQMHKRNQMAARSVSADVVPTAASIEEAELDKTTDPSAPVPTAAVQQSLMERLDTPSRQESSRDSADNMTSLTSATELSAGVSTQASSFTNEHKKTPSQDSISTDTDSSVTPKGTGNEREGPNRPERVPSPQTKTETDVKPPTPKIPSPANNPETDLKPPTPPLKTQEPTSEEHPPTQDSFQKPLDIAAPPPPVTSDQPKTTEAEHSSTSPSTVAKPEAPPAEPANIAVSIFNRASSAANSERGRRKRAIPDPLKILPSREPADMSDDESFMDELENAQVQEAKPVSVARTPITPVYSRGSSDRPKEPYRTLSTPMLTSDDSAFSTPEKPKTSSGRSVSEALPYLPSSEAETPPLPLAKKGALSSGISKRIKALEVFSHRESSSSPVPAQSGWPPKTRSNIASFRKKATLTPSTEAPNTSINTPPRPPPSVAPSTVTEKPKVFDTRPWPQRKDSATDVFTPQQKGETISVTARIIRDPPSTLPTMHANPSEPASLNMHRSPLTVEREKNESKSKQPSPPHDISSQSMDSLAKSPKSEKNRFSFASSRSNSQPKLPQSESLNSRMSFMGSNKRTGSSIARSSSEVSSIAEEQPKQSRASRLMKRMSNLTSSSRRNAAGSLSPNKESETPATIDERDEVASRKSSIVSTLAHVVDVGDINVQFPDTLLWKRRFLRIDDQGYLIFTPPTMERNPKGISRRFHLVDFNPPRLPDVEREEMAWSILLETKEGSIIQCACESKYARGQVLRTLTDAHAAYHHLYGK